MELNGIVNVVMLIQVFKEMNPGASPEVLKLLEKIDDQMDILNRYMTAISETLEPEHEEFIPMWYDVRDNRHKYKNNRGE